MPMGQYGVAGIVLIRPPEISAAADRHGMVRPRPPFRIHDVIITVFFVEMGTLRPDHVPHGPVPHILLLPHQPHGLQIQLLNPDIPVPVVLAAFRVGMGSYIIAFSVIIKKQAGVNPFRPLYIAGLGPGALRILRRHHIISPMGHIGAYHIKPAPVITDGGGKQSRRMSRPLKRQLGLPMHGVPDLLPMGQIPAVHNGQPREIGKGGIDQIIIPAHRTYGGIRVKARHNGIFRKYCHNK